METQGSSRLFHFKEHQAHRLFVSHIILLNDQGSNLKVCQQFVSVLGALHEAIDPEGLAPKAGKELHLGLVFSISMLAHGFSSSKEGVFKEFHCLGMECGNIFFGES